jgi:ABC-type transport system involved in multi-copper enzyme maturation permease subunit
VSAPLIHRFPIFAREAAQVFRRRRTYVLQGLFLLALLGILGLFWPRGDADAAAIGTWLFKALAGIELAAVALVAPALAAPSFASERQKETLGLLAIAGAPPIAIVAGKALGRLAQVGVLVAISIPLMSALFTVGGLTPRLVGQIFVAAFALGAFGVAMGALHSVGARRAEVATLQAFGEVAILSLLPIALAPVLKLPAYLVSPVAWFDAVFNPLGTTGEVEFRRWWVAPLIQLVLAAGALIVASLLLARRGYEPRERGGAPAIPLRKALLRLRRRGGPLGLTGRFGTEVAALRWRERSVRHFSDGALGMVLLIALVLFEIFAPAASRADIREGTALGLAAVATLFATVLGAAALAREKDQHTIEPLAACPIEADHFLLGKLLGLGRAVLIVGAATVVHLGLGSLRGEVPWAAVIAVAGTMPFGLAFHAILGLSFSCHFPTTVRATAWALGTAVLTAAVAQFGCLFYGLSPPVFLMQVFGNAHQQLGNPQAQPGNWLIVAIFAAGLAVAFAVVAWNHLRARFDALIGRAALDFIEFPDTMPGH